MLQISLYDVLDFKLTDRSTTETFAVGTLNDIPVSFPTKFGKIFPTAFAAPVDEGIMF